MEGESIETTSVETTPVETSSYSETESYGTSEPSGESSGYSEPDTGSSASESSSGDSDTTIRATSEEGTSFELYTDPATGKTEFRVRGPQEETGTPEENFDDDNNSEPDDGYSEEETGPSEENTGLSKDVNQAVNQTLSEIPKYTLNEFTYAMANGMVDERRVPQEYQQQYANYKIGQAQAAYAQRVQQEQMRREQAEKMMQAQSTPEARIQANKNFYDALDAEAKRFAMNDLGLTEEKLNDSEYEDDGGQAIRDKLATATNWHKQRLMNELQGRYNNEQAYRNQQQQLYSEIGEFTRQAQMNEPHFQEIDSMLATAWQNMPTKYGTVVRQALSDLAKGTVTRQEAQVIQKYYEDTRKLYYARQNGLKAANQPQRKKPPVVERAGDGSDTSYKAPDYAALRKADARGKKAWLADFFKGIEL